jgi:hypothetical protein
MRWTPKAILAELRARHARGKAIGYRVLARKHRSLVSAAAYHFGSFRNAVEAAGIDYLTVSSRPKWTKPAVIRVIKQARRDGKDLSWSAVIKRKSLLRRAAYVAVQKRLFGGWPRALEAAGVDADSSSRYQGWDKTLVVAELKQRSADGEPCNSYAVLCSNPALHAAAIRHCGSFANAVRAAGLGGKRHGRGKRPRSGK